jgi:hypothetical protein
VFRGLSDLLKAVSPHYHYCHGPHGYSLRGPHGPRYRSCCHDFLRYHCLHYLLSQHTGLHYGMLGLLPIERQLQLFLGQAFVLLTSQDLRIHTYN